ncbi:hypothetical protein TRIP_B50691 [uncultured Desulfatiglans sp.]|uniref:Uncharacterized protein n=1 Tax=Uncultured Desulfatiglans sp. TaxID=1748965 RepID=A0A653AJE2_UNCDX|nr:hypothetical protein TRIP_B50691 [uncultured Desulfatiglans sp.]
MKNWINKPEQYANELILHNYHKTRFPLLNRPVTTFAGNSSIEKGGLLFVQNSRYHKSSPAPTSFDRRAGFF